MGIITELKRGTFNLSVFQNVRGSCIDSEAEAGLYNYCEVTNYMSIVGEKAMEINRLETGQT